MKSNKVEWKNHLIELIVVFIGITLAFMLNNWREHTKNSRIESQYLSSFYDEIIYSNAKLDTIINTNKVKIRYLTNTIALLKNDDLPADSIMAVIAQMAQISLFIPKTNTYESIKNSGNFNIIENYEIRSKIIEYYESFEGKKLVEEYYKMYINNYIIPYFFENVDILNSKIMNTNLIASYRLNNLIVGYYQLLDQVVDTYENIYSLNKLLILALENEHK
jgi:hypothetical protein